MSSPFFLRNTVLSVRAPQTVETSAVAVIEADMTAGLFIFVGNLQWRGWTTCPRSPYTQNFPFPISIFLTDSGFIAIFNKLFDTLVWEVLHTKIPTARAILSGTSRIPAGRGWPFGSSASGRSSDYPNPVKTVAPCCLFYEGALGLMLCGFPLTSSALPRGSTNGHGQGSSPGPLTIAPSMILLQGHTRRTGYNTPIRAFFRISCQCCVLIHRVYNYRVQFHHVHLT